jgi:hypothetical protein
MLKKIIEIFIRINATNIYIVTRGLESKTDDLTALPALKEASLEVSR